MGLGQKSRRKGPWASQLAGIKAAGASNLPTESGGCIYLASKPARYANGALYVAHLHEELTKDACLYVQNRQMRKLTHTCTWCADLSRDLRPVATGRAHAEGQKGLAFLGDL